MLHCIFKIKTKLFLQKIIYNWILIELIHTKHNGSVLGANYIRNRNFSRGDTFIFKIDWEENKLLWKQ